MIDYIPKQISQSRKDILSVFKVKKFAKNGLTTTDLKAQLITQGATASAADKAGKEIDNMARMTEWINKKPIKGSHRVAFHITTLGVQVVNSLHEIPTSSVRAYRRGTKKPKPKPTAPPPVQLNISTQADALTDQISSVIQENAAYRDLLLQIHTTIGKALQLNEGEG